MTSYKVLSWRNVPLQVKARGEGRTVSAPLDGWFTEHADRIAMQAGILGSDAYLAALTWSEWTQREGSPEHVASSIAVELESEWAERREHWIRTGELAR